MIVESKDAYLFGACCWYLHRLPRADDLGQPPPVPPFTEESASAVVATVLHAKDPSRRVVALLACGRGLARFRSHWLEYRVLSTAPLPTDGKPEAARQLQVDVVAADRDERGDDEVLTVFVCAALDEYRKHVFGNDCDDLQGGVAYWSWDDSSGCWSKARCRRPRPLDTLYLPREASRLVEDFQRFCSPESVARYRDLHVAPTRVYMLHGRPGSGKSSLIHCLASHMGLGVATLTFEPGFCDADVRLALDTVPPGCLVRMEDVDCLFDDRRRAVGSAAAGGATFAGLLAALDECGTAGGVGGGHLGVFLTTNRLCALDAALRRRIDYVLEFGWATRAQTAAMIARYLPGTSAQRVETFWHRVTAACRGFPMSALQKFLLRVLQSSRADADADADAWADEFVAMLTACPPDAEVSGCKDMFL